jgi:uncharacterized protein
MARPSITDILRSTAEDGLMGARVPEAVLWRRLDAAGHDMACVERLPDGAELRGMAVFWDENVPCALRYRVTCDAAWRTTGARVDGWRGERAVEILIRRLPDGSWRLNDRVCPAVDGCVDLDLSFTPATNLLPLRRLRLDLGAAAEVRAAWLAWPEASLAVLPQRYLRRTADTYAYEADVPGNGRFAAGLRVDADGWVLDYGDLWRAEGR